MSDDNYIYKEFRDRFSTLAINLYEYFRNTAYTKLKEKDDIAKEQVRLYCTYSTSSIAITIK